MALDRLYWNDNLFCDYDKVIEEAKNITLEDLKKKKKYTQRILSTYFKSLEAKNILIERFLSDPDKLREFLLLEEFTNGTFHKIVGKIIDLHLSKTQKKEITKTGQRDVQDYSKYDKFAGIIKLFQKDPDILVKIILLQKTNRTSQSRFELNIKDIEKLKESFNSKDKIKSSLEQFDKREKDQRKSKFLGWFDIDGDVYLYFIREYKRSMALKIESAKYDTVCEWIILRIPNDLKQIRVSYESNMNIKDFIPFITGDIHGRKDDIEKETMKEYEVFNTEENVKIFFDTSLKEKAYPIVELRFEPAPFKGAPTMMLSNRNNKNLKDTLKWFEENRKNLFEDLSSIRECKIYFNKHRIKILFHHEEEGIAIRYLDSTLLIDERNEFEKYMMNNYNLLVIPGVSKLSK